MTIEQKYDQAATTQQELEELSAEDALEEMRQAGGVVIAPQPPTE